MNKVLEFLITHAETIAGALALVLITACIGPTLDAWDHAHHVILSIR